jgi:acyl-CoA thioesterase-1
MSIADRRTYLSDIVDILKTHWPENRIVNIVCHGNSVPTGYFSTPLVDTFNAYPHLLHKGLKQRFPFSVINVTVTGIGGESSESGARRFETEVLCHHPDVVTIDYGLTDQRIGLAMARKSWISMIESAKSQGVKMLLLTPTADINQRAGAASEEQRDLQQHGAQIRGLAERYEIGLVDSLAAFEQYQQSGDLSDLLSWVNHPNRKGHEIVARELLRWFPMA